jgi:probable H4MPT-linked C1 transfer pathway protein
MNPVLLGWDIGGVNIKVARVLDDGRVVARSRPFELQRAPHDLILRLRELASAVGAPSDAAASRCAVTMTAELSQMFRSKGEGVGFVLDAVEAAFPGADTCVFAVDGRFLSPSVARALPMAVAAANWAATARLVAQRYPTVVLIDIGTTTTDVIPIVDGEVVAQGTTDPARLASGELVYSGAVRTPVEAIVRDVPYQDGRASVSAEGFALIGDVHVWRGALRLDDYSVATPDRRAVTREFAGERLARVICADLELLDERGVSSIADAVAAQQITTIADAIRRVVSRHPALGTAVVTGVGAFIAEAAARAAGLDVVWLADDIGEQAARYAPAAAVVLLLGATSHADADATPSAPRSTKADGADDVCRALSGSPSSDPTSPAPRLKCVDTVIKVGGSLLQHVEHLDRVLHATADLARTRRVLVVPGGGPFADAVRDVGHRLRIDDDAAHWMAVLAMDQFAHLLVSRVDGSVVVASADQVESAFAAGRVPVLAPSKWLQAADPLPHTWDVTSDSIAAWAAIELRASRLILVKAPGARGSDLTDGYFRRMFATGLAHDIVAADDAPALLSMFVRTFADERR